MSRFDLFATADGQSYLLDVQSDFLESYATRVVAPVVPFARFPVPAKRLNPVVQINGVDHVVQMHFLGAVPVGVLKQPVGSLEAHADDLTRALDILFQGF